MHWITVDSRHINLDRVTDIHDNGEWITFYFGMERWVRFRDDCRKEALAQLDRAVSRDF
jgi:hypothetical protein